MLTMVILTIVSIGYGSYIFTFLLIEMSDALNPMPLLIPITSFSILPSLLRVQKPYINALNGINGQQPTIHSAPSSPLPRHHSRWVLIILMVSSPCDGLKYWGLLECFLSIRI